MLVNLYSAALDGLKATIINVEIDITEGAEYFLVGLPDSAVKESRSRYTAAISNSGFRLSQRRTTINMAPADLRKEGTGYDLSLAIGTLAGANIVSTARLASFVLVGELGLDGSLRPIKGALPIAIKARAEGFEGIIVPEDNATEAAVVDRLKVYGMSSLRQVVAFLNGKIDVAPTEIDTRRVFYEQQSHYAHDFSDVRGQENVKRAFEVAAAGGHNILLVGSPGCGKSMMSKRLPSILPPLTLAESLETTQIHSVAGALRKDTSLIATRPFRSPHHTISDVALIGGGTNLRPGEISLSHNGVLFLDELPEFSRNALETLRQPLEDREITISRAKYTGTLPCSFMLVASMNPCPCGYYNHPTHACTCSPGQIHRYMQKISGPLLDRIDLQVEVTPVPFGALSQASPGEPSESIRRRVVAAREIQQHRFAQAKGIHCNAQMTTSLMAQHAPLDAACTELIRHIMQKLDLSARAYERIVKVARTIADLAASPHITTTHISEAIGYRNLDRTSWGQ